MFVSGTSVFFVNIMAMMMVIVVVMIVMCNIDNDDDGDDFMLLGLFPVCVEVDADVVNPKSTPLTDVSVYGFVKDDDAGEIKYHIILQSPWPFINNVTSINIVFTGI